ncbi:MAG TPA: phage replisome organizer [Clostridium sp.]|nr:phage replisome organizer [Clostridium sp.]
MAEVNWVKIQIDMYDHPKLKIIDSMENRNLIHYIWVSSILLAGKCNCGGELYLTDNMPYTLKTLAIEFRRDIEDVKEAFKVLKKLKMIEINENKVFYISGWQEYQNIDGLEKIRKQTNDRVAKYREKKREEKKAAEEKKNLNNNNSEDRKCSNENEDSNNKDDNVGDSKLNDKSKQNSNNVTCNGNDNEIKRECNVTETQQKKKEIKKKTKKKSEKVEKEQSVSQQNISSDVIEISEYCERITGIVSVLEIGALNLAVGVHGKENVKRAIDKAIEVGKVNMPYVSGILKNWRKEGYPNDNVGGNDYGGKCKSKGNEPDSNKLKDFKRKEPRKLTEEERKRVGASVI